jgi:HlyD family secretion protein
MYPIYKRTWTNLILILTLIGAGCSSSNNSPITASGIVEAKEVAISSEIGGEILEILVDEGDAVKKDQVLVRFNDEELLSQLNQAKAELDVAEANYEITKANSELDLLAAHQEKDDLYKYADQAKAEAEENLALAKDGVKDAQHHLDSLKSGSRGTDVSSAEANVVLLAKALEDAEKDFDKYGNKPPGNTTRALYQLQLAEAQRSYDDAIRLLNNLEAKPSEIDLAIAEANLSLAKAKLTVAQDDLDKLQNGPDPDALALVESKIKALEAQTPLAEAQVAAAQASLDSVQIQADKLELHAPMSGVVLYRNLEAGEVALPSATVLTVASINKLKVTVYVPEDSYGRIKLGDSAELKSDSFPDETFKATVTHIADQAEFTPRNVQTQEERKNTVFAIDLVLQDTGDKIKPGMPVDVTFTNNNK